MSAGVLVEGCGHDGRAAEGAAVVVEVGCEYEVGETLEAEDVAAV